MRIAVPVSGENVSASMAACEAIRFYEDDHGRIVRQSAEAPESAGFDAALALLERRGVDVLLCPPLLPEEKRALASAGLLLSPDAGGDADAAVRAYLGRAVACDPNNNCNYCGFREECDAERRHIK